MEKKDKDEGIVINIRIPDDLHERLKLEAVRRDESLNHMVTTAIGRFLEELEEETENLKQTEKTIIETIMELSKEIVHEVKSGYVSSGFIFEIIKGEENRADLDLALRDANERLCRQGYPVEVKFISEGKIWTLEVALNEEKLEEDRG